MAKSPLQAAADVLSIEVMVEGQMVKDIFLLASVEVERQINRVGTAKVSYFLPVGDGDDTTFAMSEASNFVPGNTIEIRAGSVTKKDVIFKGTIVHQGIRNVDTSVNEFVLRCSDNAVKMTLGRKSAYYTNMKDSAIMSAIIGEYRLTADVDSTNVQHKQMVKYQSNDWDFIINRAEANGLLVYTDNDNVHIKKPLASGSPGLSVDFEKDVLAFDLGMEARFQIPSVSCQGWDMKTQAIVEGQSNEPSLSSHGNLKGKDLAGKMKFGPNTLATSSPLDTIELKDWANAQLIKSRMSAIQGSVTFFGNASPNLNTLLELKGFGDHFNKEALITSIRHNIKSGFWKTTTGFGMPPECLHEQRVVSAPSAGGVLPAVFGLLNGKVKKIDSDPDGEFRIQVDVPVIEPSGVGIWARLSHFYATPGKGSFFLPEVGDEVVLGFINDDPRFPIILGMLYSSKNTAPYTPDEKNTIKAIVTKNDLRIEFNDTDKILTIKTPGNNQFILSDKDKSIVLNDENGNTVEMTSGGISLDSAKDITLKAKGKISLEAVEGISAKASGGDVALEGLNVQAKAQVAFSAQGSASAELKASGTTTVKGAMVMIN